MDTTQTGPETEYQNEISHVYSWHCSVLLRAAKRFGAYILTVGFS